MTEDKNFSIENFKNFLKEIKVIFFNYKENEEEDRFEFFPWFLTEIEKNKSTKDNYIF